MRQLQSSRTGPNDTPCVLVVDDDRAIRDTIRLVLEDDGYEVREAADGQVGLAKIRQSDAPLVVILDLMMPKLDGAGVLRGVLAEPRLVRNHAYIMVSANLHVNGSSIDELIDRVGAEVIPKPFDLDVLIAAVAQAGRHIGHLPGDLIHGDDGAHEQQALH